MAVEFKLPHLGEGIESGEIVGVRVKVGDVLTKGQTLIEVETDKAVMDVRASEPGTVTAVSVKVGTQIKPGQVVYAYDAGAAAPAKAEPKPAGAAPAAAPEEAAVAPEKSEPAPAKSEPTQKSGADTGAVTASSTPPVPASPATAPPAATKTPRAAPVPASPAVRKFARELGVDLADVPATGARGRVLQEDVKAYVKRVLSSDGPATSTQTARPTLPDFTRWGPVERKPLKGVRKATAESVQRSWAEIPHVTQFDTADITGTEAARRKFMDARKGQPGKITMTILAIKAASKVLDEMPQFACSIDMSSHEIIQKASRHIGVAVDSENGLMVPVVRDADKKSLLQIAVEIEGLAEKVRSRKIALEEMQGAVFTISNLGSIGGTHFTPIVSWPEVAILGISRSRPELQMHDGQIESRTMLGMSLSYDHRAIDGADAARFLRRVCEILGNPFELVS